MPSVWRIARETDDHDRLVLDHSHARPTGATCKRNGRSAPADDASGSAPRVLEQQAVDLRAPGMGQRTARGCKPPPLAQPDRVVGAICNRAQGLTPP